MPSITGSTRPGTDAPRQLNERLAAHDLPVRVSNLSSIWMVHYTEPSRYNWMLQYYLRAEGLALSWVGTGRLIFSLNYTDADFAAVADRFVAAAEKMKRDGWWWHDASLTNKTIQPADPAGDACAEARPLKAIFRRTAELPIHAGSTRSPRPCGDDGRRHRIAAMRRRNPSSCVGFRPSPE